MMPPPPPPQGPGPYPPKRGLTQRGTISQAEIARNQAEARARRGNMQEHVLHQLQEGRRPLFVYTDSSEVQQADMEAPPLPPPPTFAPGALPGPSFMPPPPPPFGMAAFKHLPGPSHVLPPQDAFDPQRGPRDFPPPSLQLFEGTRMHRESPVSSSPSVYYMTAPQEQRSEYVMGRDAELLQVHVPPHILSPMDSSLDETTELDHLPHIELVMPLVVVTNQELDIDKKTGKIHLHSLTFVASSRSGHNIDSFFALMFDQEPVISSGKGKKEGFSAREVTTFKVWVGLTAMLIESRTNLDKPNYSKPFSTSHKDAHSYCVSGKTYWHDQKHDLYAKMEYPVSIITSNATVNNGHEIRKHEEITISFQTTEKDHKTAFGLKCNEQETRQSMGGAMKFREEVKCAPYSHLHIKREVVARLDEKPLVCNKFIDRRIYKQDPAFLGSFPPLWSYKPKKSAVAKMDLHSPFDWPEIQDDDENRLDEMRTQDAVSPISETTARSYSTSSPSFGRARSPRCVLRPEQQQLLERRNRSLPVTPCCNILRDTSTSPAANRRRNTKLPADPATRAIFPVTRSQCMQSGGPSDVSIVDDPQNYEKSEITTKKLQLDAAINDKQFEFQIDLHLKTEPGKKIDFKARSLRIDQQKLWENSDAWSVSAMSPTARTGPRTVARCSSPYQLQQQKSPARSPASRGSTSSKASATKSNRSTRTARDVSRREQT